MPMTPRKRGIQGTTSGLSHAGSRAYPETGCALQRLFSTFPDRTPGNGLLLLRIGAGIPLIYFAAAGLARASLWDPAMVVQNVIAAVGGILLVAACGRLSQEGRLPSMSWGSLSRKPGIHGLISS